MATGGFAALHAPNNDDIAGIIGATLSSYDDYNWYYTSYDIDIAVTDANEVHITETLDVRLDSGQTGIIRDLPYGVKKVIREINGKKVERTVNYSLEINQSPNIKEVKDEIDGYKSVYLINRPYQFSYTYSLGNDFIATEDDLYWNLLSPTIDGVGNPRIDEFTATITMPHAFDTAKANVYYGAAGGTTEITTDISFNAENTAIMINKTNIPAGYGITIRIALAEGYFTAMPPIKTPTAFVVILFIMFLIGVVFIAFLLFSKWRKTEIVSPVTFYPPKNLTPPDLAYIYNLRLQNKHLLSFLMYWDNKKYIKMGEMKKGDIMFTAEILRLPENPTKAEQQIWRACFGTIKPDEKLPLTKTVTVGSLSNKYERFDTAATLIKDKNSYFIDKTRQITKYICLVWFPLMVFIGLGAFLWTAFIRNNIRNFPFAIINFVIPNWYVYVVLSVVAATIAVYLLSHIWIREVKNPETVKLYGEVLGFRNFILTAKKEQIEMLVDKDPSYFFDLLPYAYCLDVTDAYIKNFKVFVPKYMETYNTDLFTFMFYLHFFNITTPQIGLAKVRSMASGSGGGFRGLFGGGGGFSGGGFGGGGSRGF
jgi:uncharacterized membrane protein YgcG